MSTLAGLPSPEPEQAVCTGHRIVQEAVHSQHTRATSPGCFPLSWLNPWTQNLPVEKHQALMVETTAPNPRGICWELGDGCANCSSGQSQAARAAVGWVETILSAFLRQGMWCLDGGRGCLRRGNRGQESRGWCSVQPRSSQSAETSLPFFLSSPKMLLLTTQTRTHTRVHTHVHTHIRTHLGPTHLGSRRVW